MSQFQELTYFFPIATAEGQPLSLLGFILIAELSGLLSGFLQAIVTIFLSIITYRRGLDPDVVVAPIIYTTGDVIGVIALIFITQLLFALGVGLT